MARPEDDKPRIFLSYTRDSACDRIRERLQSALRGAGFDHWRDVPPAQEPQQARDEYLDRVQGAVAIVSPLDAGGRPPRSGSSRRSTSAI